MTTLNMAKTLVPVLRQTFARFEKKQVWKKSNSKYNSDNQHRR